jgi:hypothetical protein
MIEKPRALDSRGAGLAVGQRQWRQMQDAHHGAGPQAKRSPKERSAVPGTVTMVSQVALDDLGIVTPPDRPRRRLGSGQQDRGGMGTDPAAVWPWGWSSYAFCSGSLQPAITSQNYHCRKPST